MCSHYKYEMYSNDGFLHESLPHTNTGVFAHPSKTDDFKISFLGIKIFNSTVESSSAYF